MAFLSRPTPESLFTRAGFMSSKQNTLCFEVRVRRVWQFFNFQSTQVKSVAIHSLRKEINE